MWHYPASLFSSTTDVRFEGRNLTTFSDPDKALRINYGDYMQLPPENKRKNHYPYKLDFGDYADVEERLNDPAEKRG